jgi:signal transduction histidine kinase
LLIKDKIYGGLVLYYSTPRQFSEEELNLAVTFSDQAALAIENARLRTQAEQAAVTAERNRLARDLHDSVTQTLFSASVIADVLPRLWENNRTEGQRRSQELRELTRGALAEMRTLLLELRPAKLVEIPLPDLLQQLSEAINGRSRVPITLEIVGECTPSPDVQIALYRIAQEALNNVAKHARATQAQVSLNCHPDYIELSITDDGGGFVWEGIKPKSLGLTIMQERTEAIGATLVINSQVGQGTQVVVRWENK